MPPIPQPGMSRRMRWLGNESQLWLLADPARDAQVLPRSAFEVLEVLLQGRFVELGQELRLDRRVILSDLVDELTFTHRVFSFAKIRIGPVCGRWIPMTIGIPRLEIGPMSART